MESIIVVVDDVEHARKILTPMKNAGGAPVQWVVLVCPPRLTRHIGRWLSRAAREAWRLNWTRELVQALKAVLDSRGDRVHWQMARGSLSAQTRQLRQAFMTSRVLDVRRPRWGQEHEPATPDQPVTLSSRWTWPGGAAALGAALLLASD